MIVEGYANSFTINYIYIYIYIYYIYIYIVFLIIFFIIGTNDLLNI